jgi:hypothetical protein
MIAATFHGPNHFVPNYDESTIEVFENIGHAIAVLFDRYDTKGERYLPVRYLDGNRGDIPFDHIELGDSFECYKVPDDFMEQPGDGLIEEALTAVHTGLWDYRLVLMRPFNAAGVADDGLVAVSVQKR